MSTQNDGLKYWTSLAQLRAAYLNSPFDLYAAEVLVSQSSSPSLDFDADALQTINLLNLRNQIVCQCTDAQ